MTVHYKDFVDFVVVTVLFKYIFVHGVADIINKILKYSFRFIINRLVKTHRDLVIYLHYRNAGMHK